MKTLPGLALAVSLVALAMLPALPAGPAASATTLHCRNHQVRWAPHHDLADAEVAIDSENGEITLLLTDRVVALQLSERTLRKVRRELRDAQDEQDHWLGYAIVTAVAGTVRDLIDNSFEIRVRDLRDVSYEDGRLVFIDRNGRLLFEDTDLCDNDVTTAFSEKDARKFVREFRRVKAGP